MNGQTFDICIVEGGSAGCVLARRLAERGDRSVVLVEAGPDLAGDVPPPLRDGWGLPRGAAFPYDWGFESEAEGSREATPVRRGRLLGGTSWLTRFAVRGAAADFDAWAARGNPGWSFAEVLPAFRRLEADLEFGSRDYHGDAGPIQISRYPDLDRAEVHRAAIEGLKQIGFPDIDDHNAPTAVGVGPMPMSTRAGDRETSLDAYLNRGSRPPGLAVHADAEVVAITMNGARAVGVTLTDGTRISTALTILAAGVYGSPVLLMRSGIGPADELRNHGIDLVADLPGVGSNLADHTGMDFDSGWRGGPAPDAPVLHSIATWRSRGSAANAAPDMLFWLTDPEGAEPVFSLDPILMKPASRGSVRLRSADAADKPVIRLPALTDERDIERLAEGYELAAELTNLPAMRRLASAAAPELSTGHALEARIREAAYSIPHTVGTCRMGPSPADGDVVDALGRVHGVDALLVADASVIPEPPAGFPQIVTIMLAERIAEHLSRS